MMLTGEAKKNYQREYMRRKRKTPKDAMRNNNTASSNLKLNDGLLDLLVRPEVDADGNVIYEE